MSQFPENWLSSEGEYRNIFEAASDGLVIYDIEMDVVVEANPAACEMHGFTRHEFIGLNPRGFMLSEGLVLFKKHVQTVEPSGVVESLVVHIRKDGSPFH